ncbi:selenocysteine-specific translation elongation factor [Sporosalibacterium faouarense]|uniref:selenocysteine-specific translation elongation factor n=1 Tax=Sporosalibacterium faouarense TaxID=516123 RepID=UPI00141C9EF8|nr:selenocysteine-specific translation elongation factor [Bacillota bacterium]
MKNIIIGTAGHIDHGKTTLIKALTGRETDRLKQEKERGISIELGFTYFDLPSGQRAGIIDVPGHEKFIRNMLAGVVGMDIVILVIAADEGMMPQSKEHLNILNLLDIELGFVVLTKVNLVDEDWLELVKEDIKESLKGTFLEKSPIIPADSLSGKGIDKVIETIEDYSKKIEERDVEEMPRLPVDRVFTITGFGTVVTGTLISGKFDEGDEVGIFPGNKTGKIRSIQVHGEDSESAYAGQRVALNISGLKKSEINRGDIIAPLNSMEETMMIDVKLRLLEDSQRIIENRTRIRLYLGTREILCRVVFLDRDYLTPGENCYAQLRLEEEVVAKRGDKFIIRFYSPMITIGGGEVLEPNPPKRKRFDESTIEELKIKEEGDTIDVIEKIINDRSSSFPSVKDLSVLIVMPEEKVLENVEKLKEKRKIITLKLLKDIHVIHKDYYNTFIEKLITDLNLFHNKKPLKTGMLKEELRSKYLGTIKPKLGESFINLLIERNIIKQNNECVSLIDFEVKFNDIQKQIRQDIENIYLKEKFINLQTEDVMSKLNYDKRDIEQVIEALIDLNVLIMLKNDIIIHKDIYLRSIELAKNYIKEKGSISLGEFRDLLNTSRKFAVSLLEDFDQKRITKRTGDTRILN